MHRRILFQLLAVLWLVFPSSTLAQSTQVVSPEDSFEATLVSVDDGEEIHVSIEEVEETVQLFGIGSAERGVYLANKAPNDLKRLIKPGRTIWLKCEASERGRFERLPHYFWQVCTSFARIAQYPLDNSRTNQLVMTLHKAQGYYQQNPGAQAHIDADRDMVACEEQLASQLAQVSPAPPGCHPSYLDIYSPAPPPGFACGDAYPRWFRMPIPDPHRFDGDHDGVGCEK